ncbi:hypothetical protein MKW94_017059 [Papaver nudicaule]|uniref:Hexosyltransferase n=1 Tax=Papaver nudicaule TaxID=74823 RepID=A0AA41VTP1_PAPNU|nr:hypothetical protein [Papaver nudicaule]
MAPQIIPRTQANGGLISSKQASLQSRAYLTFLARDKRLLKAAYPLVVEVLPDVPQKHRNLLEQQGCIVREIKPFVEYNKMIYLDGDIQVFENIDHLFDLTNGYFYAVMDCFCEKKWSQTPQYKIGYCQQCPDRVKWPADMGAPHFVLTMTLLKQLKITPTTPFAEQDFLNVYFRDTHKTIPPVNNLVLPMLWPGSKPRRYTGEKENMQREDIKMVVMKWWDIYNDESLDYMVSVK